MFISRHKPSNVWIFLVCCLTCCSLNVASEVEPPATDDTGWVYELKADKVIFGETVDRLFGADHQSSWEAYNSDDFTDTNRVPSIYYYALHFRGTTDFEYTNDTQSSSDKTTALNKQGTTTLHCLAHVDPSIGESWKLTHTHKDGSKYNEYSIETHFESSNIGGYIIVRYTRLQLLYNSYYQAGSVFYLDGTKEFTVPNSYSPTFERKLMEGNVNSEGIWIFGLGDTLTYSWNETYLNLRMTGAQSRYSQQQYYVRPGEAFSVQCYVTGGIFDDPNIEFTCNGTKIETGDVHSKSTHGPLEFTKDPDEKVVCDCLLTSKTKACERSESETFRPMFGPSGVKGTMPDIEEFSTCDSYATIYCDVKRSDVNPVPNVILRTIPGTDNRHVLYTTKDDVHRYKFNIRQPSSAGTILICIANNTLLSNIGAEDRMHFKVKENVVQMRPVGEKVIKIDGVVELVDGDTFSLQCDSSGPLRIKTLMFLSCLEEDSSTPGVTTTLRFQVTPSFHEARCRCTVKTSSGCELDSTYFTLKVTYGPLKVQPGHEREEDPSICDDIKPTVDMYCDVNRTDVHPTPSIVIRGLPGGDLESVYNETLQDVHRFNFSVIPPTPGTNTLMCVANNTDVKSFGSTKEFTIFVNEPPAMSPKVKINNGPVLTDGASHNSRLGHLDIECTVEGGTPPVTNVTLRCDDFTNTTVDGTVVTLGLEIAKKPPILKCECFGDHRSRCYRKTIDFDIVSIHGPTKVVPSHYRNEEHSICYGIKPTVDMYCDVNTTDVHSVPSVTLQGLPGGDLNLVYYETLQDVYRFNFSFIPPTPGTMDLICVTNNTVFKDIGATQEFTVFVKEPPAMSPKVKILNGPVLTNGSVHNSRLGHLDIECTVEGGTLPVSNITLKCDDFTNTTVDGTVVTLGLEVIKDPYNMKCECFAKHASDCYDKTTQFNVVSIYGPTEVVPGHNRKEEPSICDGIKPTVDMYCDVNRADVNPIPSVILHGVPSVNMYPVHYQAVQNVHRFYFSFIPHTPGTNSLKCVADNTVFNDYGARQEVTVYVNEPPLTHPEMFVDGGIIVNGNVFNASLGITVEVVCKVEGGYPDVARVVLECDGETNTTYGTESAITLQIQRETHRAVCKCHAYHTSECYQKTAQFSIEVWEPTFITSYTLNSKSQTQELMVGSIVTFVCEAEGIPTPNISIKGNITGKTIPGDITTVNYYTSKIKFTKPMTCGESDSYVCISDNGIATQSSLDILVTCPPQMFNDPTGKGNNYKKSKVTRAGLAYIVFDIVCRPHPIRYRLNKRGSSKRRQRRDVTGTEDEIEIDPSHYEVEYQDININHGQFGINFIDTDIDDVNNYMLEVDNGVGDGLQIEFETELEKVPPSATAGRENSFHAISLSIVSIVALFIIIVIVIIVAVTCYTWFRKDRTKTSSEQRKTTSSMNGMFLPSRPQRF